MGADTAVQFDQLADSQEVARRAAQEMLTLGAQSIADRGRFRVVLAGGTTPLLVYRLLAEERAEWSAWEIYFGDERCLPPEHPDRNSLAACREWLDKVPIPRDRVFPVPAELGAERAAEEYSEAIQAALPFDLVLLGMGEDGHTASLFPGRIIATDELVIPVQDAPKPPPKRVSLTPKALSSCSHLIVLVTGASKREALSAWRRGADLPVARVAAAGNARVLIDRAAAGD